jgi:hypothetical protein
MESFFENFGVGKKMTFFESFGVGKKMESFFERMGLVIKWNLFLKISGLAKK